MKKIDKAFHEELNKRFAKKQNEMPRQAGVMGGADGRLRVAGRDGYVYVTIADKTIPVFCNLVGPEIGRKVWVGYASIDSTLYQVLSTRSDTPDGNTNTGGAGYAPAKRYEWLVKGGGQDPLHVHARAITYLKIGTSPTGGLNIQLFKGFVYSGSAVLAVNTQDIDLTAQIPAGAGDAALVLITINNAGAVVQTKGPEVPIADLIDMASFPAIFTNLPAIPAGWVCGAARVYNGQTAFQETHTNTDFVDLRFLNSSVAVVGAISSINLINGGTAAAF